MVCGNCGKKVKETTTVHIKTGKRGRPPIKEYCSNCLETETGKYYLAGEPKEVRVTKGVKGAVRQSQPRTKPRLNLGTFDPAAVFLLSLLPDNLFEPSDLNNSFLFRCKGCREVLKMTERVEHFQNHKQAIFS